MARVDDQLEQVHLPARHRVMTAALAGGVAAAVVAWFAPWELTLLVGWDVTAVVILVRVWMKVRRFTPAETRAFATYEDDTRATTEIILLVASTVSLASVALAFVKARESGPVLQPLLTVVGIATIVLSWLIVHAQFLLRYAHLYYSEPVGGIDFKTRDEEPDYRDFAYVAFTVGMTYQVSDTDITARRVRRTVLHHALVSFFFGAVILATLINLVAQLLNN
jgi:uncharacterized membrane protein